jgi:hypothetical protein
MVTLTSKLNIKTLLDYIDLARYTNLLLSDNNKRYEDRHE